MEPIVKRPSKADITRKAIKQGLTNEQVVEAINEVYPGEGKLNCVRWYRKQDPTLTGKTRATSVKKAEVHTAFKEALNAMEPEKASEILLTLVEKNIDAFISKIDVIELKSYIPAEYLPVEPVKEPKAPKAKKAKKSTAEVDELNENTGKAEVADVAEVAPTVEVADVAEVAPTVEVADVA